MNTFLLSLFKKYTALLHRRCSDEFQLVSGRHTTEVTCITHQIQIVNADDYMPMTVNDLEQYDDIIDAGFYVSGINRDEITSV